MSDAFFEKPILNSPYDYPRFHWELDEDGQPTERTIQSRRKCSYVTPVPKPKKKKGKKNEQPDMFAEKGQGIKIDGQIYDQTSIVNKSPRCRGFVATAQGPEKLGRHSRNRTTSPAVHVSR